MKLWQVEVVTEGKPGSKLHVSRFAAVAETAEEAIREVCTTETVLPTDLLAAFSVEGKTVRLGTHLRTRKELTRFWPQDALLTEGSRFL